MDDKRHTLLVGGMRFSMVALGTAAAHLGYHSRGWQDKTLALNQNTHWAGQGDFASHHAKLGEQLAKSGLLAKANLRTHRDYLADERLGVFLHDTQLTDFLTCAPSYRCEVLVTLKNGTWVPQYARTNQDTHPVMAIPDRAGGLFLSHIFEGPVTRALWFKQLHWRATATAMHFSVIRHIGGYASEKVVYDVPLTLPSGEPDVIFGTIDY